MTFAPPPPVDTPEAVAAFARRFPEINARGWLAFARATPIVRPPLLARLPAAVPWHLTTVREELRAQASPAGPEPAMPAMPADAALEAIDRLRTRLVAAAAGLPDDFLGAAGLIAAEGREALARASRRSARRIPDPGLEHAAVGDALQLPELLGHAFYVFLNRRDRALAAHLETSFLRLMHFGLDQRRNQGLGDALRTQPPGSFRLFTAIEEAVDGVLLRRRDEVFQPLLQEYLSAAKDALRVLRDPGVPARTLAVFKQRVFHAFNAAAASCGTVGERLPGARRELAKTLAWAEGRLGEAALTQARSRVDNFLEKLEQFDRFFAQRFCLRELAVVRAALDRLQGRGAAPDRAHGRHGAPAEPGAGPLTATRTLWLQPAKDYLEYRKGMISGDCTSAGRLAGQHLRHPRFFNVRIFTGHSVLDWRGNVYCLDFTGGGEGAVVVDRVQIDRSEDLVPLDFFPSLLAALAGRLFAGLELRVLAPRRISNFARLQESYERWLAEARPPLERFAFDVRDRSFECSGTTVLYRIA